jgi:hypothetical protein
MVRAREHVAAGWSASEAARLIEREFGVRPHTTTVRTWTDPTYYKRFTEEGRAKERARWQRANPPKPNRRVSAGRRLEWMRELRQRGLPYRYIAQVAIAFWGDKTSEETVRRRLLEEEAA